MAAVLQRGMSLVVVFVLAALGAAAESDASVKLWALKPVVRSAVPVGVSPSANPIDAFIAAEYQAKGLKPVGPASRGTLLRRVYLDLIGIPPTPEEQAAFDQDSSPDAYEKVVDRLLASEQHGVRYARHWLDVLRYADADENMVGAAGIYLWRDWVINALNHDVPYDQFVRAQLTGYRTAMRTQISPTGQRSRIEPRPDDLFALGFLARAASESKNTHEFAIAAVETVSTAFMGLTVGCAKCHDHFYDPIAQHDFYAMKALFDPLVARKIVLATPAELTAAGRVFDETAKVRAVIDNSITELVGPARKKLYDDRVAMLPPDVRAVILKPEKARTAEEQKLADDYYPILRIDTEKIMEVLPAAERGRYRESLQQLERAGAGRPSIPVFWTVEVDSSKTRDKSFVLTSGDPERPEKDHEVKPGWPFAPAAIDFRDGRVEAFSDWLTMPENPLFARVAVNRLWQWHFGEGLQKTSSDFGKLGGVPTHPQLLDWLASEFAQRRFSMKALHRLIVTSETYKLASDADAALETSNRRADSADAYLWRFRLRRLEAEPIWDSIHAAAGHLNLSLGGPSFDVHAPNKKRNGGPRPTQTAAVRRAAYMIRGYSSNREIVPSFLQTFDVDDGRTPCPMRTRTVTAPQALFMMNSDEIESASARLAERLRKESGGDLTVAVDLAYRITLARRPSASERDCALAFLENNAAQLKNLAWLLFNLDEFIYVR